MTNIKDEHMIEYVKSNVTGNLVPIGYENNQPNEFFVNKDCGYFPCHQSTVALNCLHCYCPLYHVECPGEYTEIRGGNGIVVKDCSDCILNHQPDSHKIINKILECPIPWIPEEIAND